MVCENLNAVQVTGLLPTATRDRFLANLSHELRTPLNAMIGYAGTMKMGLAGSLSEEQLAQVGTIYDSGRHLLSLVEELLESREGENLRIDVTGAGVGIPAAQLDAVFEKFTQLKTADVVTAGLAPQESVFAPFLALTGGYGLEWRVMIQLKNLSKTYSTRGVEQTALEDVSLTIEDGDIFGIIGISGAGKSTLVRCINLLEKPTLGSVVIDGVDVTAFEGRQLSDLRATIGMIFQDFNLFAQRTVLENVTFPLEIRGDDRADRERHGMELLDLVGLSAKAKQYPSQLSGGQQQRVSIARALANHPRVILCDEATSALDSLTTNSVLKLLRQINQDMGVTMVVITHEIGVVEKICNRVAVIDGSRIVEQGGAAEVLQDPQADVTRRLLGRVRWDA